MKDKLFKALKWFGIVVGILVGLLILGQMDFSPVAWLGALICLVWWHVNAQIEAMRRDLMAAVTRSQHHG